MSKRIIPFDYSKIDDTGDCLAVCIKKIFDFKKFEGVDLLFSENYPINFTKLYDMNGNLDISAGVNIFFIDYIEKLNNAFNITCKINKSPTIADLKAHIEDNDIGIVTIEAIYAKWTGITIPKTYHDLLITGYDTNMNGFICADPYFSQKPEYLPFDSFEKGVVMFRKLDFSDFKFNKEVLVHRSLIQIRNALIDCSPARCLEEIYKASVENYSKTQRNTLLKYVLSGAPLLTLSGRFACLNSYYKYLYSIKYANWMKRASDIYASLYYKSRNALTLVLKYLLKESRQTLDRLLADLESFALGEAEVEQIVMMGLYNDEESIQDN